MLLDPANIDANAQACKTVSSDEPFFSIIVPTRNRPAILRRALASLAAQTCAEFEAIIVDDGSSGDCAAALRSLSSELDERFVFVQRAIGDARHGPNIARNAGFAHARGSYIGFLDDDDYWCDERHLEHALRCLREVPRVDLYVANQVAKRGNEIVVAPWLPFLDGILSGRPRLAQADTYELRRSDLLQPDGIGFVHVNICIVRRELFQAIEGFWNEAPYEGDLNFFLRLMDKAHRIIYRSATVSVNTVRDATAESGVSSISDESKRLFRILACQHAELRIERPEVKGYTRLLHGGALRTMAKHQYRDRNFGLASALAARAVAVDPTLRWRLVSLALKLRAAVSVPQGGERRGS